MPTVILIRHGRSEANASGVLAGRTPGVGLDDVGSEQADALADRLGRAPLARVVTSPLERCRQTAERLKRDVIVDDRLNECDYGTWTGRALSELRDEPLWRQVQHQPSAVTFPDGESMRALQARALAGVADQNEAVAATSGPNAVWAAVTHADVIKTIVADALGMHLDNFQRLIIEPGSASVVHYGSHRHPVVWMVNVAGAAGFPVARDRPEPDIAVGGGAGTT